MRKHKKSEISSDDGASSSENEGNEGDVQRLLEEDLGSN
jgi:hypothetical protein